MVKCPKCGKGDKLEYERFEPLSKNDNNGADSFPDKAVVRFSAKCQRCNRKITIDQTTTYIIVNEKKVRR